MSQFSSVFDGCADSLVGIFGESCTYKRIGSSDATITAIPADPTPEDGVTSNQYTVRVMRGDAVANGPRSGDQIVISSVTYDIFGVRATEGDPLVRVFLSKS